VVSDLLQQDGTSPLWNGTRRSRRTGADNATQDSTRRHPGRKVRPQLRLLEGSGPHHLDGWTISDGPFKCDWYRCR
jgi:hypothetical protein